MGKEAIFFQFTIYTPITRISPMMERQLRAMIAIATD